MKTTLNCLVSLMQNPDLTSCLAFFLQPTKATCKHYVINQVPNARGVCVCVHACEGTVRGTCLHELPFHFWHRNHHQWTTEKETSVPIQVPAALLPIWLPASMPARVEGDPGYLDPITPADSRLSWLLAAAVPACCGHWGK